MERDCRMKWPKKLAQACLGAAAVALLSAGQQNPGNWSAPHVERPPETASAVPPAPAREFRAVWIATLDNIDWPSKPGLPPAQQRAELTAILDRAAALHFNAVILQVRPACDAIYSSRIEPWSEWLTGQMGKSPGFFYDPLSFAVAEAHRRGLQLHAWMNPFRARKDTATPASSRHVSRTRPQLIRSYGKLQLLDPSDPETRRYTMSVVSDVLRRYDIDGILFDDYFYPYPDKAVDPKAFDAIDEGNWRRYRARGGKLARGDWRRENINAFVEQAYRAIKAEKPWVRFGISPFGIWRPGYPSSVTGLDAFDKLYADSRLWLAKGWVDYLAPQLYWSSDAKGQNFTELLQWWNAQSERQRPVWPGLAQMGEAREQIRRARALSPVPGEIFWHARQIMDNTGGVADALRELYAAPAVPPAAPWLRNICPAPPRVETARALGRIEVRWESPRDGAAAGWVIQARRGALWETRVAPAEARSIEFPAPQPETVSVSALDRYGNLSAPALPKTVR